MRYRTSIEIPTPREAVWEVLVAAKRIRLGGVNVLTPSGDHESPRFGRGSVMCVPGVLVDDNAALLVRSGRAG